VIRYLARWCALGAALYSPQALAPLAFEATGRTGYPIKLVLHEEPCTNPKVTVFLTKRLQELAKRSVLTWEEKDWASCWIEANGTVHSIDEAGDAFQPIPKYLFRELGTNLQEPRK
jgi:hypothetical protein